MATRQRNLLLPWPLLLWLLCEMGLLPWEVSRRGTTCSALTSRCDKLAELEACVGGDKEGEDTGG